MEIFFWWVALSGLAGLLASKKGRSFFGFFCLSLFLSPLFGIIGVFIAESNLSKMEEKMLKSGTKKRCPTCAEIIQIEAKMCRFCGFNHF